MCHVLIYVLYRFIIYVYNIYLCVCMYVCQKLNVTRLYMFKVSGTQFIYCAPTGFLCQV